MEMRPTRVLWPTDFSELSLHAGRYAAALCEKFGAALHIVHVIPPPVTPDVNVMFAGEVPLMVSEQDLIDAGTRGLARVVELHFNNDPKIVREVCFGNPWIAVCDYARRQEIDLIVVSTHGRAGIAHAVIGSTAERIVQHAPCPVLTVKHKDRQCLV